MSYLVKNSDRPKNRLPGHPAIKGRVLIGEFTDKDSFLSVERALHEQGYDTQTCVALGWKALELYRVERVNPQAVERDA